MEPLTDRVKRWDVYDIADELADVPWMLRDLEEAQAVPDLVRDLVERLFEASERGGDVGPSPDYLGTDEGMAPNGAFRGAVFALGASALLVVSLLVMILAIC